MAEPNFFSFLGDVPVANGRLHRRFETYDYLYSTDTMLYFLNKNKVEELAFPSPVVSNMKPGWYYPDFRFQSNMKAKDIDWIIIPRDNCVSLKNVNMGGYTTYYLGDDFYSSILDWEEVKEFLTTFDIPAYDVVDLFYNQNHITAAMLLNYLLVFDEHTIGEPLPYNVDYGNKIVYGTGQIDEKCLYMESTDPDDLIFRPCILYYLLTSSTNETFFDIPCDVYPVGDSDDYLSYEVRDNDGNVLASVGSNGEISTHEEVSQVSVAITPSVGSTVTYTVNNLELETFQQTAVNAYDYDPANWNIMEYYPRCVLGGYVVSDSANRIYPYKYKVYEPTVASSDILEIKSAIDDEDWEISFNASKTVVYVEYVGTEIPEPEEGEPSETRTIKLCFDYNHNTPGEYFRWYRYWDQVFTATYGNTILSKTISFHVDSRFHAYSYKDALVERETGGTYSEWIKSTDVGEEEPEIQGTVYFDADGGSDFDITYSDFGEDWDSSHCETVLKTIDTIDVSSAVITLTLNGVTYTQTLEAFEWDFYILGIGYRAKAKLLRENGSSTFIVPEAEPDNEMLTKLKPRPKAMSLLRYVWDSWTVEDYEVTENIDIETVEIGGEKFYVLHGLESSEIVVMPRKYDETDYQDDGDNTIGAFVNEYFIGLPHISFTLEDFLVRHRMFFDSNSTKSVAFQGRAIPETDLEKDVWVKEVFEKIEQFDYYVYSNLYENHIEIFPNEEAVLYFNEGDETTPSYLVYTKNARYENVDGIYFLGNYLCMKTGNVMKFVETKTGEETTVEHLFFGEAFDGWRYDGNYFYFYVFDSLGISISKDFGITTVLSADNFTAQGMTKLYGGTGGGFLTDKGVYLKRSLNVVKNIDLDITGIVDGQRGD